MELDLKLNEAPIEQVQIKKVIFYCQCMLYWSIVLWRYICIIWNGAGLCRSRHKDNDQTIVITKWTLIVHQSFQCWWSSLADFETFTIKLAQWEKKDIDNGTKLIKDLDKKKIKIIVKLNQIQPSYGSLNVMSWLKSDIW